MLRQQLENERLTIQQLNGCLAQETHGVREQIVSM